MYNIIPYSHSSLVAARTSRITATDRGAALCAYRVYTVIASRDLITVRVTTTAVNAGRATADKYPTMAAG